MNIIINGLIIWIILITNTIAVQIYNIKLKENKDIKNINKIRTILIIMLGIFVGFFILNCIKLIF